MHRLYIHVLVFLMTDLLLIWIIKIPLLKNQMGFAITVDLKNMFFYFLFNYLTQTVKINILLYRFIYVCEAFYWIDRNSMCY